MLFRFGLRIWIQQEFEKSLFWFYYNERILDSIWNGPESDLYYKLFNIFLFLNMFFPPNEFINKSQHMCDEKNPYWLGYLGAEQLPSYIGVFHKPL